LKFKSKKQAHAVAFLLLLRAHDNKTVWLNGKDFTPDSNQILFPTLPKAKTFSASNARGRSWKFLAASWILGLIIVLTAAYFFVSPVFLSHHALSTQMLLL
jgi:hypothetical protein